MEAVETALRAAVLSAGANLLSLLLKGVGRGRRGEVLCCFCGKEMESKGLEEKRLVTLLGEVAYRRSRYECRACGASRYPGDEELDMAGTSRSPGVRRMMARAGSRQTFKEAKEDLKVYAGIGVSAKDVERVAERIGCQIETWRAKESEELLRMEPALLPRQAIPVMYIEMDGTGVPMVPAEVTGRKGKQPDGTARTREAKLGCVFTQTQRDETRRPIRDPDSTTFVGAIETAEAFGARIEAEAIRRGVLEAQKVVILGDGAVWIRKLTELRFPGAMQIVDLYHAKEHVANLARLLFVGDEKEVHRNRTLWWTYLEKGDVERIEEAAQKELPDEEERDVTEAQRKARGEIHYLMENKDRMRYATFREKGFFVGSGVVEAGCKSLIGGRLKQSGMEWTVQGANAIIALRCNLISGRFEDFWEDRAA